MVLSVKTEIKIQARAYQVRLKDTRTGEKSHDTIVLTKEQIRAGAMFDLGNEDIIYRAYNRQGFRVLEIGKPEKLELTVDLEELYLSRCHERITEREVITEDC